MIYQGETVAFSTKSNVWKTRYSFNPTCYMDMDDDFLSSAPIDAEDTRLAWRHDISPIYNWFYDSFYPSTIRVSSNQNPSATKAFKSLSLETNTVGWTARVQTNLDRGGQFTLAQDGFIRSFESKEGNQYAAMPRNSQGPGNSTSNVIYVANILLSDLFEQAEEGSLEDGTFTFNVPLQSIPSVAITPAFTTVLYLASTSNAGNLEAPALRSIYIPQSATEDLVPIDISQGYIFYNSLGVLSLNGYNPQNNSIELTLPSFAESANMPNTVYGVLATMFQEQFLEYLANGSSDYTIPIYMMTNPRINGDLMRGPYATIDLTLPYAGTAFELHSINVDYENTKLDGSLG